MRVEEYKALLQSRLDEKRYYHSLCVADEARRLACKYGADADKMYLAGLLHDITKNETAEEQLQMFKECGIILTDVEKMSPAVWHAYTGALFVENKLKIDDRDIVSAIKYHSTGKADMTLPQKIVYIADLTSRDRNYPDVEVTRQLLEESLDKAILYVLKFTLKNLSDKNLVIHPDTLDAYNYLIINSKEVD